MIRILSLSLVLLSSLFARPAFADGPKAPTTSSARSFSVTAVKDVAYYTGDDADPIRHKLDLYLPEGAKDYPVMVFVHGGTWRSGRKEMYGGVGRLFARQGIGTAVINYRLSPQVQHPAHVQDVAQAFAWVHSNIAKYGGRPDRIFLCGHSAGGHLVSLLATDEKYLQAEKLSTADVRGVIGVSGVYVISPVWLFESAFGSDVSGCLDASPLTHVHPGRPPFLLLYAERDFQFLDEMAEQMGASLKRNGCTAEVCKIPDRNHITIVRKMALEGDPVVAQITAFIDKLGK